MNRLPFIAITTLLLMLSSKTLPFTFVDGVSFSEDTIYLRCQLDRIDSDRLIAIDKTEQLWRLAVEGPKNMNDLYQYVENWGVRYGWQEENELKVFQHHYCNHDSWEYRLCVDRRNLDYLIGIDSFIHGPADGSCKRVAPQIINDRFKGTSEAIKQWDIEQAERNRNKI